VYQKASNSTHEFGKRIEKSAHQRPRWGSVAVFVSVAEKENQREETLDRSHLGCHYSPDHTVWRTCLLLEQSRRRRRAPAASLRRFPRRHLLAPRHTNLTVMVRLGCCTAVRGREVPRASKLKGRYAEQAKEEDAGRKEDSDRRVRNRKSQLEQSLRCSHTKAKCSTPQATSAYLMF